jgi:hypothetical protein
MRFLVLRATKIWPKSIHPAEAGLNSVVKTKKTAAYYVYLFDHANFVGLIIYFIDRIYPPMQRLD